MPSSPRSRALSVLLLLSVSTLHVTGESCSSTGGETLEISGDEPQNLPKTSPSIKWKPLTYTLIFEVNSLSDQQFEKDFDESKENKWKYEHHRLELPNIVESECSSSNLKDDCLLRISKGLQQYALYLLFVERECSNSSTVSNIKFRTKVLIDHVMTIMNNSKRAQQLNLDSRDELIRLPADSWWRRKITVYVLLRDYLTFLQQTLRALRYIEGRGRKRNCL